MTNPKRWLDELPLGSQERELLLVGKAARPAEGALEANWKALSAALGSAAAISGTFATSAAAHSATASTSATVGASIAASKVAGSAGLSLVIAKSLAVGVGIGLAVMGAAAVAERVSEHRPPPAVEAKSSPVVDARRPLSGAPPTRPAQPVQPVSPRAEPLTSPSSAAGLSRPHDTGTGLGAGLNSVAVSPAASSASTASPASAEEKTASLARQARELAELKRLIDSGASGEALRRLNENFSAGTDSVLSEERDALYAQALAGAHRGDEAKTFARQFMARYPHSPYFETMRQLLSEE